MMKKKQATILLCEDDVNYGMLLCDYFKQKGYKVDYAQDGEEGWQKFNAKSYDFCVLDVMMPVRTGFELCKAIRMTGSLVPVIFLTARTAIEDVLEGYHCGADDYVLKPCSMDVLMCKMESILSRYHYQRSECPYDVGTMYYDSVKQEIEVNGDLIHLSSKENDLLLILAQNANRLVERKVILTSVWHNDNYFASRSLSVYINRLRKVLSTDDEVRILNVHGKGYKLLLPEKKN